MAPDLDRHESVEGWSKSITTKIRSHGASHTCSNCFPSCRGVSVVKSRFHPRLAGTLSVCVPDDRLDEQRTDIEQQHSSEHQERYDPIL